MSITVITLAITPAVANVSTDQADYAPGSVVTISGDNSNFADGEGYLATETVHVEVVGPNGYTASCDAVAGLDGAWSCQITLWDTQDAVGAYSYVATGLTSGVSETGNFTDQTQVGVTSATFVWNTTTSFDVLVQGTYTCDLVGSAAGDCNDADDVTITIHEDDNATNSGGTIIASKVLAVSVTGSNVAWSFSFQFRPAPSGTQYATPADGQFDVQAVFHGKLTGVSRTSTPAWRDHYFGVDDTLPTSTISTLVANSTPSATGTATDPGSISPLPHFSGFDNGDDPDPMHVEIRTNPGNILVGGSAEDLTLGGLGSTKQTGSWSYAYGGAPLAPGGYCLVAWATDHALNVQNPATTSCFTVVGANTPPSISVTGVTNGSSYTVGSVPTAGCSVTDTEDGPSTFAASLSAITGPDAADGIGSQTASCSYTDGGGLTATASATYAIVDSSAPAISYVVTPSAPDGLNDWYVSNVQLVWTVSEPQSPGSLVKTGCIDQNITADQAATTYSCSATSAGGSTGPVNISIKRDASAPTVSVLPDFGPDYGTWYNAAVLFDTSGSDVTSGLVDANCTADQNYTSPDGTGLTVGGSCTDNAGNVGNGTSAAFDFDDTNPTVIASPSRIPDHAGWYNLGLLISFNATDATSGPGSCDAPIFYEDPDSSSALVGGSCSDLAGNSGSGYFSFMYDDNAPTVTISTTDAELGGWYNIASSGTDGVQVDVATADGIGVTGLSCTDNTVDVGALDPLGDSFVIYDGSHFIECTAVDAAGNEGEDDKSFDVDQTNPYAVSGDPNRAPDHGTWYNAPVDIVFIGSDATSGIDDCTTVAGYDTDGAASSVLGSCTDNAGNTSADVSSSLFDYDNTNPVVSVTPDRAPNGNGWYGYAVVFDTSGTDGLSGLVDANCTADQNYTGPDGTGLTVSGSCTDNAGNTAGASSEAFNFDDTDPTVSITFPVHGALYIESSWEGGCVAAVGDVCGTAADLLSGIDQVNVGMKRDSTGLYWNWTTMSFSSVTELFTNAGGTAWNRAFAYANFPLSGSFTLHAQSVDLAGNMGNAFATFTLDRYTIDYQPPLDDSNLPSIIKNKGKYGRVIPVKVALYKDGVAQGSANFGPTDLFTINVNWMPSCVTGASDSVETYADAGASNGNTNLFRWADGKLIYNLDTKAPPMMTMVLNECYRLDIYLNGAKLSYNRTAVFQPIK